MDCGDLLFWRAAGSTTLGAAEDVGQEDHEAGRSDDRLPDHPLAFDAIWLARSYHRNTPPLRIHNPILGDAGIHVEVLLLRAVPAPCATGEDFDDETRYRGDVPIAARLRLRLPHHEVGFDLRALEAKHGTRMVHEAEAIRRDERDEQHTETSQDRFVFVRRRRRHEQLTAYELVLVAVVGEAVELLERPHLAASDHRHDATFLGKRANVGMPRGWQHARERPVPSHRPPAQTRSAGQDASAEGTLGASAESSEGSGSGAPWPDPSVARGAITPRPQRWRPHAPPRARRKPDSRGADSRAVPAPERAPGPASPPNRRRPRRASGG